MVGLLSFFSVFVFGVFSRRHKQHISLLCVWSTDSSSSPPTHKNEEVVVVDIDISVAKDAVGVELFVCFEEHQKGQRTKLSTRRETK